MSLLLAAQGPPAQAASSSTAIRSWVVPAVAIVIGAVSAQSTPAQATWSVPSVTVVAGNASAAVQPAVYQWAVPAVQASVASESPPAGIMWRPWPRFLWQAPPSLIANTRASESRWHVPRVSPTTRRQALVIPASARWIVPSVSPFHDPDFSEDDLASLLAWLQRHA